MPMHGRGFGVMAARNIVGCWVQRWDLHAGDTEKVVHSGPFDSGLAGENSATLRIRTASRSRRRHSDDTSAYALMPSDSYASWFDPPDPRAAVLSGRPVELHWCLGFRGMAKDSSPA